MENKLEQKKFGRKTKIIIAAAAVVMIAGVSVYAVSASAKISEAEARQIALAQVQGADASHITKFQKDMDDGRQEYDIEIIYGGYEYDFEISAKDGRIYDQNKEQVESWDVAGLPPSQAQLPAVEEGSQSVTIEVQPEEQQAEQPAQAADQAPAQQTQQAQPAQQTQPAQPAQTADIGLEKAKSIALGQVSGAASGDIFAAYSDYDDGRLEYDVTVFYNGYEYEFEIDGATGNILSKDVERIGYDD